MNILADASLPGLEAAFPSPFRLSTFHDQKDIPEMLKSQAILLCRSTLKVNEDLIRNHSLKFVATASSGTDHLDHAFLNSKNITIIDAKGCNAVSVGDYVLACLAYLQHAKLIHCKTAAIIGMGKVGTQVHKQLSAIGFDVIAYDPPRAERDPIFKSAVIEELYHCDLLCVHAELQKNGPHPSYDLINTKFLELLKPQCVIINAARGGIVNEQALLEYDDSIIYCTDVFLNEPDINKSIVDRATLCTPHIAGHSIEAKYHAVTLVSEKLHGLLKLSLPQYEEPIKPARVYPDLSWVETVLSIYNPLKETESLKSASDLLKSFIQLRKMHHYRHNFVNYFAPASVPSWVIS